MTEDPNDSPVVHQIGVHIGEHLDEIKELFKPGYKLTLLCRNPEHPDGSQDMVLSDDTISEAIAALDMRRPDKEIN